MKIDIFAFHEKVSIQDAPSFFGAVQIATNFYPACFCRIFHFSLEAQTQGMSRR
jgi:hypothetical protein